MKFKHLLAIMAFIPASLIASVSFAAGVITGISAPASAVVNTSVSVTVNGSGTCEGGYTIYWGDGGNTAVPGTVSIPNSPSHTYTTTGTKTISVDPGAGCSGSPATTINITAAPSGANVTGISGPSTDIVATPYAVTVTGTGTCALVTVNWGDGSPNATRSSYNLAAPTGIGHTYTSTGTKTITATGSGSGCSGSATKTVTVNSSGGGVIIPRPEWFRGFKIWVKPKFPKCPLCPVCTSCPDWFSKIKWREAQMTKYAKLAQRPGKRQAYYMRQFKMHKAARANLINKYNSKHRGAMKIKRGAKGVPRRGMQRKMAPGVRHQMK